MYICIYIYIIYIIYIYISYIYISIHHIPYLLCLSYISITFINKTYPPNPLKRKNCWKHTLKTFEANNFIQQNICNNTIMLVLSFLVKFFCLGLLPIYSGTPILYTCYSCLCYWSDTYCQQLLVICCIISKSVLNINNERHCCGEQGKGNYGGNNNRCK